MRGFGSLLGYALGLAVVGALLAAGYYFLKYVGGVFATLELQTATLAAIAGVVALLCAVIVAEGLKAQGQRAGILGDVAARANAYDRVLRLCMEAPNKIENGHCIAPDMEHKETERLLALYGSAEAIAAYIDLRNRTAGEGDANEPALLNRLIKAMRKDMGRTERLRGGLGYSDLLLPGGRKP